MTKFNRVLIIPIMALVLGAVVLTLIRSNKPTENTNTTQEQGSNVQLDYPFVFDNKKLTAEVVLDRTYIPTSENKFYKIDPYDKFFPSQNLAKDIAKKLDLSQSGENTWNNKDSSVSFIKSTDDNYIRISLLDPATTDLDEESLSKRAEDKLESLAIWPFSSKESEKKATILEEPNLNGTKATLTLSEKINSYPVITNSKGSSEIYIEFNSKGQITEIVYFYVPYKTEEADKNEFKNIDEIETSIENGEYKKIEYSENFNTIQIISVENSYYTSTASDYIQPIIIVTGINEFDEEVKLLVPAYKDKVY